ncbi:MAG: preprotein translocase subunit SecE [Patescibacteria group bacterium]|nr:MAG: preprotein translocase subunit SecE [Patescibacteria group bacterium]
MSLKENKVIRYFYEAKEELEKVTWPTRRQTIISTLIVIGVSIGTAAVLGGIDFGLNLALQAVVAK